jgi:DNA-binding NtrC family response regulator
MHKAKEMNPDLITIILTAYGSVEAAVSAMKQGAYDFVTKPINLDEIDILLKRAISSRRIEQENISLRQQLEKKYGFDQIIGNAPQMKQIFETIKQVAPTKATVLITGESGTGKELIANAIHLHSLRKDNPFVDVHCAALVETLLESELFGHEKGAFTGAIQQKPGRFELADGGTLFMDEVSEMNLSAQVKLLRVLETQKFKRVGGTKDIKVDIRLIAATNTSLEHRVKEGKFREDLYYRLNVVAIRVPPLRERKEDIPVLLKSFLNEFNREHKKQITGIHPDAMQRLMDYSWPGNVRELRNMTESIVILSKKHEILLDDLPVHIKEGTTPMLFRETGNIQEAEKVLIMEALRKTRNNKTKAAQIIGISRRTLHRKLHEYGINQ